MLGNKLKNVKSKFLTILKYLAKDANQPPGRLRGYEYIKPALSNERIMLSYFDSMIHDLYYVSQLIEDKTILDAGCGSGIFSVLLSLLGARKVYAVDVEPSCIEMTKYIVDIAKVDNIDIINTDISMLDLSPGSIEGIFSIESLSHISNYTGFLSMIERVLKKKGFFVIRDGNNGASPFIRHKNYKIWDAFENHPETMTIFGHSKGNGCYFKDRENIIRKYFPQLNSIQVEEFARYTFAYDKDEIATACKQFIKGDFSLRSEYSYGKTPRCSNSGVYMERLLFPHDLKRELERSGFNCTIKSLGPSRRKLRILTYVWELLSPILIFFPRPFEIIAIKKIS